MTALDTPDRYGTVTRILHWGMAALFAAQFASAIAHWGLPRENGLRQLLWGYHYNIGLTLFALAALRGMWGLANLRRRPAHSGTLGTAAAAGQTLLYALMIAVPAAKIIQAIGSTYSLSWFGLTVVPARESEIAWLAAVGEVHGILGWALLATIVGHVSMALVYHRGIRRDGTLERMTG